MSKDLLAVELFLTTRFAHAPIYRGYVIGLWRQFEALGLANEHFVRELTSGKMERFYQRLWEMMLGCHLDAQGYRLASPKVGPDFRFEANGQIVWVEAICPEPQEIPSDWLEPPTPNSFRVGGYPHEEVLLRWTAAFAEKARKFKKYIETGLIRETEACVIAINGVQLGLISIDHGISQLPLVLETVFPIGPISVSIDVQSRTVSGTKTSTRFGIKKANGAWVKTTPFVVDDYSHISAVLGYSRERSESDSLLGYVAHNPKAAIQVQIGTLGRDMEEWRAAFLSADELEVSQVSNA